MTIWKYLQVHKKTLNEKKWKNEKVYAFVRCAGLGSKRQKNFTNCQPTYQKELVCCLKNQAMFFTERTYR